MLPEMMSDLFEGAPLSVSQLNAAAKDLLENRFAGVWVGGEISGLTRAASGHYYFSLKDAYAQVRCALFKHTAMRLAQPLREGAQIEVCGRIGIYEARGDFQITVQEVRQVGLGALFERYERLKRRLEAEGLFDNALKKRLPENPQRVGVVTSLAAAALRDVLTALRRRAPQIAVTVYPAAVQGAGSVQQLAAAITAASERNECDVLIVCRGGGSMEDLWSFNEEPVVRAIAACVLPVVCGVGHETDFTLSDFAADVRAPTPTAAAELVSPDNRVYLKKIAQYGNLLQYLLQQYYQNAAQKTDFLAQRLHHPKQKWTQQQQQLDKAAQWFQAAFAGQMHTKQQRVDWLGEALSRQRPNVHEAQQRLEYAAYALFQGVTGCLNHAGQRLSKQEALLEAISPQSVMQRGFAVVRNQKGEVVRRAGGLQAGQKLNVLFAEGSKNVLVAED